MKAFHCLLNLMKTEELRLSCYRVCRFPFIACEIFTCEIDVIFKTLVEDEEVLCTDSYLECHYCLRSQEWFLHVWTSSLLKWYWYSVRGSKWFHKRTHNCTVLWMTSGKYQVCWNSIMLLPSISSRFLICSSWITSILSWSLIDHMGHCWQATLVR